MRRDWLWLLLLVAVLTAAKAPLWSLDRPLEADEIVYLTLSERLPHRYDLQGAKVLQYVSPEVYDRPLFFHPPLFSALVKLGGENMLVPWAANAATLWLVWWLGTRWLDRRGAWFATLLYAACPVAFLCGCRLWMDGLLTMWMTAAVAGTVWALEKDDDRRLIVPGFLLGLASLTKLPGLLAALPMAVVWLTSGRPIRTRQLAAVVVPVVLLLGPWLLTLYRVYHSLGLAESRIPDAELPRFPFMGLARSRPFWFYVAGLLLVAPAHFYSFWGDTRMKTATAWAWGVIVALTWFSLSNTFQLRYILPALPALCLLGGSRLSRLPSPAFGMAAVFMVYAMACGVYAGLLHRDLGDLVPVVHPTIPGLF
ncbi:MAG TPA: glycosyltransferase family 39 protein [Candidatus Xenobia bacterium]